MPPIQGDGAFMAHRALARVALSAVSAFAWIFIFQFYYSLFGGALAALIGVSVVYAFVQVTTLLATPAAAAHIRHGVRRSIALSITSAATAFIALYATFLGFYENPGMGIALFALFMGLYRALFWVPYAVRGNSREPMILSILIAIMPALTGIYLAYSSAPSPEVIFLTAAAWLALSLVPLSRVRESYERFAWSYRGTFHELFSGVRRRLLLQSICEGIEAAALLLVWPIVIFAILGGSYEGFGIVLSLTYLIGLILRSVFARYSFFTPTIPVHAALAASAWIVRATAGGFGSIVLIDTYYATTRPQERGIDPAAREQSADNATFVDEHTALKEMGLCFGRLFACLALVVFASSGSFMTTAYLVFILAAIAAATSVVLARTR